MKSIAPAAMAAIEAGEAIVTGALEIYTPGRGPVGVPEATDVVLSWHQSGDDFIIPGSNDVGRMGFSFHEATGDQIGDTVWADLINAAPETWTLRTLEGSTPPGANILRVYMEMERRSGVWAQQAFDNISLSIGGAAAPLVNPGAELGNTTGWSTPTLGPLEVKSIDYFGDATVTPYEGSYFFTGGENIYVSAQQDVYLSEVVPVEPGVVEAVLRVWGGYGPIELDGEVYQGIGDKGLAQQTAGAIGGFAQGLNLVLSGIEPEALVLLDAEEIRGGAVVLRRLIFASDGKTLLDYDIWDRGRVDTVETVETIGGGAAIKLAVESAARGLGRSGGRMRSDSDQRLINPNDGYFRFCSYAGEKMLYWGGRKPGRTGGTTYIGNPTSGGVSG